jgi:uncharacterized protein (TIGR02453 family)
MAAQSDWCFSDETVAFLTDLRANNTREWFADNKAAYERTVKKAGGDFAAQICVELEALTGIAHAAKIFRIHRDLRFSKDKTPYNTHLHISFLPERTNVAWFFGLDPDGMAVGAGVFGFEKAALAAYRDRVIGPDGDRLAAILASLENDGVRVGEPALKRVPQGFDPDHPRASLLRHKGLTVWSDYPDTKPATKPGVVLRCVEDFGRFKPLVDWLMAAGD